MTEESMKLIKNANVYAPEALGEVDVLLAYDKIIQIGKNLNPNIDGIEIIDAKGKTLIPGIIDQHVHLTGGGGEGGLHTRVPEIMLSSIIKAGVTTVVGMLGTDSYTRSVENLVAKTIGLKNEGISAFCLTGAYKFPTDTLTDSVAKDIVFIDEVIGCKIAISDHRCSRPTKEEFIRLLSDLRMAALIGKKAGVLHVHVGATPGGVDFLLDIVKTTDIPITHLRPTHLGRTPDDVYEFTKMGGYADITAHVPFAEKFCELVKNVNPELLTISSDSNGSTPKWNDKREIIGIRAAKIETLFEMIREMVLVCKMPLEQALTFVTTNVSKALNMPNKGCIALGADADLVLLDSELQIDSVFAMGKTMMLNKELLVKGTFED